MRYKLALFAIVGLILAGCGGVQLEGVAGAPQIRSVTLSPTTLPSTGGPVTVTAQISGQNVTAYVSVVGGGFQQRANLTPIEGGYYQATINLPSNPLSHSVSYSVTVYATNPYGSDTYYAGIVTVLGAGEAVETATVTGRVIDAETGEGIEGATVSIGGVKGYTDHQGHFILSGVPTGTQTLKVEKLGYISTSFPVDVKAPSTSIPEPIALVPETGGPPPPPQF